MADEEHKVGVVEEALMILGMFALLIFLWFMAGGPGKAELKGLFLSPPQPLGSGESYGPQIGQPNSNINTQSNTVDAPQNFGTTTNY